MSVNAETLLRRLSWDDLDPGHLRRLVEMARDEDLAGLGLRVKPRRTGDQSTAALAAAWVGPDVVPPGRPRAPRESHADLVAREPLIACGLPLIPTILAAYGGGAVMQLHARDGRAVAAGGVLATLSGDPRTLLAAERVILNFLQRLSGIAGQTRRYVDALGDGRTRLLDTRKTTPGWRMLEKYAVACGGGWNHRLGLFDRVMLKDNHLAVLGFGPGPKPNVQRWRNPKLKIQNPELLSTAGSVIQNPNSKFQNVSALGAAVAAARRAAPDLPVEVEVDRPGQIPPVLAAGADVILLDNFAPAAARRAVALIAGRAFTEASGGITLRNLARYAGLGLDFVSTGALVHHSVWADLGLDWRA